MQQSKQYCEVLFRYIQQRNQFKSGKKTIVTHTHYYMKINNTRASFKGGWGGALALP